MILRISLFALPPEWIVDDMMGGAESRWPRMWLLKLGENAARSTASFTSDTRVYRTVGDNVL